VTVQLAGCLMNQFQFLAGARDCVLSELSRPALWPTQPPIQCVQGIFPWGLSKWSMKLALPPGAEAKKE
jgi:hypothetical protein